MFVGKTLIDNFYYVSELIINKFPDGFINEKYTLKGIISFIPLVILLLNYSFLFVYTRLSEKHSFIISVLSVSSSLINF